MSDSADWTGLENLTPRERQVAACMYRGWSNKEIGYALRIDETTVKRNSHNIYEKAAVKDIRERRRKRRIQ